ncbi:MAG TPA: alpha/beta fold hydrolase [Baekduia sp.]|uniref:alpha/beta fold hydrolase n=1 Tax=Baekduia sp. TaxID=2600305 RepID=UPI002D79ACE1|nr:alpha/beta fold hydrolase [Baekduia sp.]HET6509438.1 alpha/beta fold hydrolase [Baekduia sp.]
MTATIRTTSVTVDGVRSPVLEAGPADAAEAVVFVHGNPGVAEDWRALLEPAGAFARAVAITMPGYGDADKPRDLPYTVPGYARHLAGALDALGVTRVHLVLHDFGGPWGLQWAVDHPERHASTTLVNTGVILREKWHALARVWRTPGLGELFFMTSTRGGTRQFMRRTNPPTFPASFGDHLYDLYQDQGTRRAVLRLYRNTPIGPHVEAVAPRLREHPRPTLVVWGAKDPYLKVRLAERQREVFRDARVEILPASGHWPLADAPDAVAAVVLPFLARQAAAPTREPAAT